MNPFAALLYATYALYVFAAPTIETHPALAIRKGLSARGKHPSAKEIVERDRARIAARSSRAHDLSKRIFSTVLINEDVSYVAPVTLCGMVYYLIVDTGSANTCFGAGKVPATCGSSSPITIGGVTFKATFGVCNSSSGLQGVDGILGLGSAILTQGTGPTILDDLKSLGIISVEAAGFCFAPESGGDTNDANGELTFGGTDPTKYTGPLTYFPKSTTSPYSLYWGVSTASLQYGTVSLEASANAIVDTGTTLLYIPSAAYNKFLSLAGGTTDSSSGLARFKTQPTNNFIINIGSVSYPLTPAQYLVPTAQYSIFGLSSSYHYAWINDGGSIAANVNFIIGQKFLENYYTVIDVTNSRIGLATRA